MVYETYRHKKGRKIGSGTKKQLRARLYNKNVGLVKGVRVNITKIRDELSDTSDNIHISINTNLCFADVINKLGHLENAIRSDHQKLITMGK